MMIRERTYRPDALRTVKFRISLENALALHTTRLLEGRTPSTVVRAALDEYFAALESAPAEG